MYITICVYIYTYVHIVYSYSITYCIPSSLVRLQGPPMAKRLVPVARAPSEAVWGGCCHLEICGFTMEKLWKISIFHGTTMDHHHFLLWFDMVY